MTVNSSDHLARGWKQMQPLRLGHGANSNNRQRTKTMESKYYWVVVSRDTGKILVSFDGLGPTFWIAQFAKQVLQSRGVVGYVDLLETYE
jgi:hypothetical protein